MDTIEKVVTENLFLYLDLLDSQDSTSNVVTYLY